MMFLIVVQAIILSVAMAGAWWFQRRMRNAGWVDVIWTFATAAAGIVGAAWLLPEAQVFWPRQVLAGLLMGLWSVRLGSHLGVRVMTRPEDARYAGFRRDWGSEFQRRLFWLLQIQAAAALPLAVSVLLGARNPSREFGGSDGMAILLFTAAVIGEAMADRELARFIADPVHKGCVCDRGLWAWSRHPNYFFEFLGWCAWPLFAFNPDWPLGWIAWLAPVLMYWLLVHVSGIPPLERVMLSSRGDAYRAYQRQTSTFFPLPPRRQATS
jgi:steroid 5-alpha reductase family enzyme